MDTTRRQALKTITAAALATTVGQFSAFAADAPAAAPAPAPAAPTGPFTLPPLPYKYDALEPHIDEATMHLHHDKHHAAYVANLNKAVASIIETKPLSSDVDELLKNLDAIPESIRTAVRNNGGGHSNHSLFWQTLTPFVDPGIDHLTAPKPPTEFTKAIVAEFGDFDKFKEAMNKAGAGVFGSGWVWLVLDGKKLAILALPNQDSPLSSGKYPLFGIDVWEHAYYLKYHNVRADYLKAIWNVVNWDFISARYAAAMKA